MGKGSNSPATCLAGDQGKQHPLHGLLCPPWGCPQSHWHVTRGWQLCTGNPPGVKKPLTGRASQRVPCHTIGFTSFDGKHTLPVGKHPSAFPRWRPAGQKQYPGAEQMLGRGRTPSLDTPPPTSPTPTAGASQGRSRSWSRRWPAGHSSRRHRSRPACCCTPCDRRRRGASRRSSGRASGSPRRRSP